MLHLKFDRRVGRVRVHQMEKSEISKKKTEESQNYHLVRKIIGVLRRHMK